MSSLNNIRSAESDLPFVEGLILSVTDYKERDQIAQVFTSKGILSFYCRGVRSLTSKNKRLLLPFGSVRLNYEPRLSRDMLFLINGTVIHPPVQTDQDLLMQSVLFVLRDLLLSANSLNRQNEVSGKEAGRYKEVLEKLLERIEENSDNKWLYACFLLAMLIHEQGISPDVDECVRCQRKSGIQSFSVEDGGFVCKECLNESDRTWSVDALKKMRALFKAKNENLHALEEKMDFDLEDFEFLCRYWKEHMQSVPASMAFLEDVLSLEKKLANKRRKKAQEPEKKE